MGVEEFSSSAKETKSGSDNNITFNLVLLHGSYNDEQLHWKDPRSPLKFYIYTVFITFQNYSRHIPKHASLISVLSVLWMTFTTNITASGVKKEIAWKEKTSILLGKHPDHWPLTLKH